MPEASPAPSDSMIPTNVMPTPPDNLFAAAPTNLFGYGGSSEPWSKGRAMMVIGGGSIALILLLLVGLFLLNSAKSPLPTSPAPTPVVTPISPPAEPPVPAPATNDNTKTYTNDAYKDFTFKYDGSAWALTENGTTITLTNSADPTKKLQVDLAKNGLGMYTGNLAFYCGEVSKVLKNGVNNGTAPNGSVNYAKGLARARVDVSDSEAFAGITSGTYYYSQNYFEAISFQYNYGYQKQTFITNGLCVDNYGVTVIVENVPEQAPAPQGDMTRSLVKLLPASTGWTESELAAADAVVLTMSMK